MNDEMKVIREINIQAEAFYEDAEQLGTHAAAVLGRGHRSQMTSLETIAESALKTSDIFDYVKKQIARFPYWREGYGDIQQGFGERLLEKLEVRLIRSRDTVSSRLKIENKTDEQKQERRRIHLLLMRQFIRQMVVQYEFRANAGNAGNASVGGRANNGTRT